MFRTLSLRTRLITTMGLLGLIIVATGMLGIHGMRTTGAALEDTYSNELSTVALGQARNNLARARFALDRAVAHPDAPDTAHVLQSMFRALEQAVRTHDTAHIATLFTRDIIATFGAFNDASAKLDD